MMNRIRAFFERHEISVGSVVGLIGFVGFLALGIAEQVAKADLTGLPSWAASAISAAALALVVIGRFAVAIVAKINVGRAMIEQVKGQPLPATSEAGPDPMALVRRELDRIAERSRGTTPPESIDEPDGFDEAVVMWKMEDLT